MDLDGRVAIVTGAGRGLGREHALLLAAYGARVVVNDRGGSTSGEGADVSVAEEVVAEIRARGGEAVANGDSVADFEGGRRLVGAALDTFGRLDVLVNNAGILRDKMLVNMSEEEFDAVVAVHLKGTFCTMRHAAEHWRSEHKAGRPVGGAVVNTSSGAALFNNVGQTNYAAAKAAIAAFSQVAAKELVRYGVRVNTIAPMARTRLVEQTPGMGELVQQTRDAAFDPWAPSNISPLVVYLASPRCPHTGGIWHVFGGRVDVVSGYTLGTSVERTSPWTPEDLETELAAVVTPRPGEALSETLSLEAVTQLMLEGQLTG